MSEHDPDIDFDFFEDEPATEETSRTQRIIRRPGSRGPDGPSRPPRAPQNLTPLLRLVGLIAFAILIIVLLVFWIQSCQASGKTKTYKSYMTKIADVGSTSQQIGRQLGQALLTPGVKRAQLQQQISGLARQEQQDVNRARGITPPGPLRDEHQAVIQALEYRVSGLAGLANALGATAGSKDTQQAAGLARLADAPAARERRHLGRLVQGPGDDGARPPGSHRHERQRRPAGAPTPGSCRTPSSPRRLRWRRSSRVSPAPRPPARTARAAPGW